VLESERAGIAVEEPVCGLRIGRGWALRLAAGIWMIFAFRPHLGLGEMAEQGGSCMSDALHCSAPEKKRPSNLCASCLMLKFQSQSLQLNRRISLV
jgi:hypothetical protein